VLARTLRNLKAIYLKADDHERALRTAELLVLLNPGAMDEVRDRGLVLAALECYALAAADLEAYVEADSPGPGDAVAAGPDRGIAPQGGAPQLVQKELP
jgi:regulator of sirC expression with transglutaminase-like and TPR domain